MSINPSRISKKTKAADPLEKKRLRSTANAEHYDSHKDKIQQKKFRSYWYKKVKEILKEEAIEWKNMRKPSLPEPLPLPDLLTVDENLFFILHTCGKVTIPLHLPSLMLFNMKRVRVHSYFSSLKVYLKRTSSFDTKWIIERWYMPQSIQERHLRPRNDQSTDSEATLWRIGRNSNNRGGLTYACDMLFTVPVLHVSIQPVQSGFSGGRIRAKAKTLGIWKGSIC